MHSALHIAQQNLFDIGYYANLALNTLEPGAGELPQWMNNKISIVRTHMKDVGHFVRFQTNEGKSFAGDFDPGYIARKNLREIAQYADAVLSATKKVGQPLPAWADNKLSGAAELMDCVGHSLVNEAAEGRRYGVPGIPYPQPGWAGAGGVATRGTPSFPGRLKTGIR